MKRIFLAISIILLLGGCEYLAPDKVKTVIRVKNTSAKRVYSQMSTNFPDTTLLLTGMAPLSIIEPGTRIPYQFKDEEIQEIFAKSPGRKLSFFILNEDTVNAYHWDTIRNRYNILVRKDLTMDELKSMEYTVEFP